MSSKIETHEIDDFFDSRPCCPFCQAEVLEFGDEPSYFSVDPCPHLLFFCHDEGWEYLSKRVEEEFDRKGINVTRFDEEYTEVSGVDAPGLECGDSPDFITNEIEIPGAVKYSHYVGPPSFYGSYLGFAPIED